MGAGGNRADGAEAAGSSALVGATGGLGAVGTAHGFAPVGAAQRSHWTDAARGVPAELL